MPVNWSETPLVTKLGAGAGQRLIVIDEPRSGLRVVWCRERRTTLPT